MVGRQACKGQKVENADYNNWHVLISTRYPSQLKAKTLAPPYFALQFLLFPPGMCLRPSVAARARGCRAA